MTKKEFENAKEPWTFHMTLDPVTGKRNYEYLEGWDWSGYIKSIQADFPERFHYMARNQVARIMFFEAHGITGLGKTKKV